MKPRRKTAQRGKLGNSPACDWPGIGEFSTRYGANALAYLRARTDESPWFAVVSGVMHAGQIDYNAQQPIAEKLLKHSPDVAYDMERTAEIIEGAQDFARVLTALTIGAHCYFKHCGPSGKECHANTGKLPRAGENLIECLRTSKRYFSPKETAYLKQHHISEVDSYEAADDTQMNGPRQGKAVRTAAAESLWEKLDKRKRIKFDARGPYVQGAGLGAKTRNLVAEYLGCDNAVAVDRHVGGWLANDVGRVGWVQRVLITKRDKLGRRLGEVQRTSAVVLTKSKAEAAKWRLQGVPAVDSNAVSSPSTFALLKKELHEMASECGVRPAELQVAAWAQGVCDAGNTGIYLGNGKSDSCDRVPRIHVGPAEFAAPIKDRPPAPGERFSCGHNYLGGAAETAAAAPAGMFRITSGRPKPPLGELWTYKFIGRPALVRFASRAEAGTIAQRMRPVQPVAVAGQR